ncbi:MAG: hypothetical protein ABI621_02465 [Chloroflexota bacterium]
MTLKDNKSKNGVFLSNVKPDGAGNNTSNLFAVGAAFLGFAVIGLGIWWWRLSDQVKEGENSPPLSDAPMLDELITEVALLDETHEQKGISAEEYRLKRRALLERAKQLSRLVIR